MFSINHYTGERKLVSRTVFSFVAIDENGKPKSIPKIVPSSEYEKKIFEERAMERRLELKLLKVYRKLKSVMKDEISSLRKFIWILSDDTIILFYSFLHNFSIH